VRLKAQRLDFIQPIFYLAPEVAPQLRREIKPDQFYEMPIERIGSAEDDLLDHFPRQGHD
jgi:hypothetical protein